MPLVPMLSGHPNFMADVKATPPAMSFLFPDHPMASTWADLWTPDGNAQAWLRKTQDDAWKNFDARNWVYQTWAYDAHDVGTTPGFGGDYYKALRSIRARMLVLAGVGIGLAVAPVKKMLPLPRGSINRAASRPARKPE